MNPGSIALGTWHPDDFEQIKAAIPPGAPAGEFTTYDALGPPSVQRRCLAVHEAGHAAAGIARGWTLQYLWLNPDTTPDTGKPAGSTRWQQLPDRQLTYSDAAATVVIAAAGGIAQLMWLAENSRLTPLTQWVTECSTYGDRAGALTDLEDNDWGLSFTSDPAARKTFDWLTATRDAVLEMQSRWEGVRAIADRLYGTGRLDGPAAHQIIKEYL